MLFKVLDAEEMALARKKSHMTRSRKTPIKGYNSTLILKPSSNIMLIPENSQLKYAGGSYWEAHTPEKDEKNVKKLALALDAIAYMC
jgi:hypothetical protein